MKLRTKRRITRQRPVKQRQAADISGSFVGGPPDTVTEGTTFSVEVVNNTEFADLDVSAHLVAPDAPGDFNTEDFIDSNIAFDASGTATLDFTIEPDFIRWVSGTYKLVIRAEPFVDDPPWTVDIASATVSVENQQIGSVCQDDSHCPGTTPCVGGDCGDTNGGNGGGNGANGGNGGGTGVSSGAAVLAVVALAGAYYVYR